MRPVAAWSVVIGLLAASIAALWLPAWPLAAMAGGAYLVMRRRTGFTWLAATTLTFNALVLGWLMAGPGFSVGPIAFSQRGLLDGLVGGLRLIAMIGVNLATLQRIRPALLLDGLRLPKRATGFLAAVLIAAHDIGRDFDRMRAASRLAGDWPDGRIARAISAARLMPGLLVVSHDRALRRRDALALAGIPTGPGFAPIVAVTALAAAGRLAFIAFPNIALTYAIIFAAGVAFGPRIAAWSAVWSMSLTNLMLSGLYLPSFVNVPAMVLLAWLGGWLHGRDWAGHSRSDHVAGLVFAALAGFVGTLLFSAVSDALTWALVAENRQSIERLVVGVVAGLTFNVVPAIINAVLFAATIVPVATAFRQVRVA